MTASDRVRRFLCENAGQYFRAQQIAERLNLPRRCVYATVINACCTGQVERKHPVHLGHTRGQWYRWKAAA